MCDGHVCFFSPPHTHHSLHEDIRCALQWSSEGAGGEGVGREGAPTCQEVLTLALTCALDGIGDKEGRGLVLKAGRRYS